MEQPTDVFEAPAMWRADIIDEFRLRGAKRCAAASPSPGFPQVLESLVSTIEDARRGLWLDVGGGLGGVASWPVNEAIHTRCRDRQGYDEWRPRDTRVIVRRHLIRR